MDIRKFFHKRLKVDHEQVNDDGEVENHQMIECVEKWIEWSYGPAETADDSQQPKTTSSESNNGSLEFPLNLFLCIFSPTVIINEDKINNITLLINPWKS